MRAINKSLAYILTLLGCTALGELSATASTVQLITNGGFETGDLTGWSEFDQPGSSPFGGWSATSGTLGPITPTVGPASGTFYAVSGQFAAGTHALIQSFTVPAGATSVVLSFAMFVNSWVDVVAGCDTLDFNINPSQCARVDILTSSSDPFDTTSGVVTNLFSGSDPFVSNPNPYTAYDFKLTGLLTPGATYQLRFAEVDNQSFLNQGVDSISLTATTGASPEPTSILLFGAGLAAIARFRNYRRSSNQR